MGGTTVDSLSNPSNPPHPKDPSTTLDQQIQNQPFLKSAKKVHARRISKMGVFKNSGTPNWIVYNGKPYFLMDDLGGKPTSFGNPQMNFQLLHVCVNTMSWVTFFCRGEEWTIWICLGLMCDDKHFNSWLKTQRTSPGMVITGTFG